MILNTKQWIWSLAVLAAFLVGHSHAQGNGKCAANGEYCLLHSDCCSGSCLSFSYKCVPTPPSAAVGTTRVPVTVDTANRFGGPSDGGASITQKTCARNGEYCLTAADCCSKSCLSFSYKCVHNYDLGQQVLTETGLPINVAPVSSSNSIDTSNRFGSGSDRQCSVNGARCYRSGECCSGACYRSTCSTHVVVGVPESELTRPSVVNGPYVQVNSLDDLITRFGGGSQAPQQAIDSDSSASSKRTSVFTNRNGTGRQCVVTGESCHRHEQCCSLKCLTYIRKCVT